MKTRSALSRSGLPALVLVVLAMLVGVCGTPSIAMAQGAPKAPEVLKPPTPATPDSPPVIWNYLMLAVVIGLAGGAALIPSKRGHQD